MVNRYICITDATDRWTLNGENPMIEMIGATLRTWDHLDGLLYEAVGRSQFDGSPSPAFMVLHKEAIPAGRSQYTLGYPKYNLVKLFEACETITGDEFNQQYETHDDFVVEPDAMCLRIRLANGPPSSWGPITPHDRIFCIHFEV